MVIDVRKITEARAEERRSATKEERQARALEYIADTLEAIRGELVGLTHVISLKGKSG